MTRIPGYRLLHSPGPTHVPAEVLHAMALQPMDLADPRLARLIQDCETGLKRLLLTQRSDVFFYTANGHGGWEAVIANLLAPGQAVLVPGTGHFSDSWALQAEALGARIVRTGCTPGHALDPTALEDALRADTRHDIVAVFVVHTDTASATTCDLHAVRAAIDSARHPALLVVDVVASLAAAPFEMDALRVNVAIGASQKGLMLPPGMAFVAADEQAMQVAQRNVAPRFYWDWVRRKDDPPYRKFCGTPPMAHLAGLRAALTLIETEGLANVHARHRRLAGAVHAAVGRWSRAGALDFYAQLPAARSVSVTAVEVQPGIDPEALRTVARERFQAAIAGGLGPLSGKGFRIGHLGDVNEAMILGCLGAVEAAMKVQAIPFESGLAAATEYLARNAD